MKSSKIIEAVTILITILIPSFIGLEAEIPIESLGKPIMTDEEFEDLYPEISLENLSEPFMTDEEFEKTPFFRLSMCFGKCDLKSCDDITKDVKRCYHDKVKCADDCILKIVGDGNEKDLYRR